MRCGPVQSGGIMLNAPFLTPHYIPLSPFWTIYNSNSNIAHRYFLTQSNPVRPPHPPITHDFCTQVLLQGFQSIIFYWEWDKKAFQAGKAVLVASEMSDDTVQTYETQVQRCSCIIWSYIVAIVLYGLWSYIVATVLYGATVQQLHYMELHALLASRRASLAKLHHPFPFFEPSFHLFLVKGKVFVKK